MKLSKLFMTVAVSLLVATVSHAADSASISGKITFEGKAPKPKKIPTDADPKCAAGSRFPKTVDDHEAVQQVAKQIVEYFRIVPTATAGGPARVRAFNNAGRVMIEISQSFTMDAPASPQPDILSSISLIQDGDYWVLWMFAAGSKGELDELRRSKIFFDDPGAPAMDRKTP